MLDRARIAALISSALPEHVSRVQQARTVLSQLWRQRSDDALFCAIPVTRFSENYTVIAVDGSQIFPDRHCGMTVALVHVGTVVFSYKYRGVEHSTAQFLTDPEILFDALFEDISLSEAVITCRRTERELKKGLDAARSCMPDVLFFDGSLIFWHLENQAMTLQPRFLASYLTILSQLADDRIIHAGYISLPKSRELLKFFGTDDALRYLVDTDIAELFLKPNQRTRIFASDAHIGEQYPARLKPYFFYLHTGREIARVEIPAWIAQEESMVDTLAAQIMDQISKGDGYPISLAEAHEQAVIKGADRDFFYQFLEAQLRTLGTALMPSNKSSMKRRARI